MLICFVVLRSVNLCHRQGSFGDGWTPQGKGGASIYGGINLLRDSLSCLNIINYLKSAGYPGLFMNLFIIWMVLFFNHTNFSIKKTREWRYISIDNSMTIHFNILNLWMLFKYWLIYPVFLKDAHFLRTLQIWPGMIFLFLMSSLHHVRRSSI
jgi:hypothetical protein